MLAVKDIYKAFGAKPALAGVSFEIPAGAIVAALGPSGCGKSTLLNIIAGLEIPDRGEVTWDGVTLTGVPAYRRGFGLMFQDFALFPHLNVIENVAFGLRMQHQPAEQIRLQVKEALELVGLPGFELRDVNTLSGGEQQRVALARALAPKPRLLMLDEPLGALDRTLRERLVLELREILKNSRQTALYVTHDQQEAFALAERLVVLNAGKVEQVGAPEQVYRQPANPFVARFLGMDNLLKGKVSAVEAREVVVETPIGRLLAPVGAAAYRIGQAVTVLARTDALQIGEAGRKRLYGHVVEAVFRGSAMRVKVNVQGALLVGDFPSQTDLPAPGESIIISFDPAQALQIFPSQE